MASAQPASGTLKEVAHFSQLQQDYGKVYVALATPLDVQPVTAARALMVSVTFTEMGPLYRVDDVVGALPLVV